MKRISFIFIVVITFFCIGCAEDNGVSYNYYRYIARSANGRVALLKFISGSHGYSDFAIYTGNELKLFETHYPQYEGSIGYGLAYVNDTIMALGRKEMFVSNDNGKIWTTKKIPSDQYVSGFDYNGSVVVVLDSTNGFGSGYNILISNDQCNTWEKKFSSSSIWLNGVRIKGNKIIAVGAKGYPLSYDGVILISDDNGNTWSFVNISIKASFREVDWVNNNIIVIGNEGKIVVSHDNGNTWSIKNSGVTNDLLCVQYYGSTSIVSINTEKYLLSIDNGDTWTIKTAMNPIYRMTYNGIDAFTIYENNISRLTGTDFIALSTEPSHLYGCEVSGEVITFAQFKPNTLESPLHYCDKNGEIKSIALVKPGTRAGSRFRIKVNPASEYAKMLLGENNDGILAFQTYVQ